MKETHETEIKVLPFPLLAKQLKLYEKQLSDAIWEVNTKEAKRLKEKISLTKTQISLGETYDIPF